MRAVTGLGTRLFYWRVGLLGHDLLPDSQICTIINSFYIYSTCMHYPPTVPPWRPHSLKMTLYKNGPFLSLIFFFLFLENLYMWTFLTSECVWLCLFFCFSEECNTRATMSHIQTLWSLAHRAVRGFLHLDCF